MASERSTGNKVSFRDTLLGQGDLSFNKLLLSPGFTLHDVKIPLEKEYYVDDRGMTV
jgi:hypothetical protein